MEEWKVLLEELQQAPKRSVGVNQSEKAVLKNEAAKVFIAEDADSRVTARLVMLCEDKGVELVRIKTMHDIGRACGIHVKAAAAVIHKI